MTYRQCFALIVMLMASVASAENDPARISVSLNERLGPMAINQFALGQGGLSVEPMWDSRIAEIGALRPKIIRLFVQEYFDLMPEAGQYHFDSLDRSIDTILATGAKPLLALCFKPKVLFPEIDQDIVEPIDYACYYHIRDYHVSFERFEKFMSPKGTAFMEGWWNRMPQFDGLFDFQDTVRPTYFTFKLLSRLTGDRLRVTSSHAKVHGFATRDDRYTSYQYNLMLWNFSSSVSAVEVTLDNMAGTMTAKPIVLDATTPSHDEIARLRPQPPVNIQAEQPTLQVLLEPYQIRFWSLEQK